MPPILYRQTRYRVCTVLTCLALLVPFAGCGARGRSDALSAAGSDPDPHRDDLPDGHREGVVELSAVQLSAIALTTVPVERRHLAAELETTGEVGYEEDRIAHVTPRVPGRVQRVPVSLGDDVAPGQVLAVLDSVELGQARAAFVTARTREELARVNHEREQRLFADGITPERDLLHARADHLEAVAVRRGAEETLRLYGLSEDDVATLEPGDPRSSLLPVRSPIAGRVVEKHATLGELATPGDALFTVADLGHVWVWIDVYERDLSRVHLGDGVEVRVAPFPGQVFSGQVTYLSPRVEAETRTVRARIDVDNAGRLLRPGMFATVRVVDPHREEAEASLVIPDGAVVRSAGATLVFVPLTGEDGAFQAVEVTLGRREAGWVEVVSGLAAGQSVVDGGTFFLESELAREELGGGHGH